MKNISSLKMRKSLLVGKVAIIVARGCSLSERSSYRTPNNVRLTARKDGQFLTNLVLI
jgi:hypothetical protein